MTTMNIGVEIVRIMNIAEKQDVTLQTEATSIAKALLDSTMPLADMETLFKAAQKPYRADRAKAKEGDKEAKDNATRKGKAWGRATVAMSYHFRKAKKAVKWPKWTTGEGEFIFAESAEYSKEQRDKRKESEEADKVALREFEQDKESQRIAAVRQLGPDDMAAMMLRTLEEWGGDRENIRKVLATMAEHHELTVRKRPAKRKAKSA